MIEQKYKEQLRALVEGLDHKQRLWLNGYLEGLIEAVDGVQLAGADTSISRKTKTAVQISILFGTQTGNSRSVAENLKQAFAEKGIDADLVDASTFKPKDLKKLERLFLIVSTHGDGEAPDAIANLYKFVQSAKAPDLSHLSYAIFGLGDSSYPKFCQTAKDFDDRFKALGANALMERVDADVDFDELADRWIQNILELEVKQGGSELKFDAPLIDKSALKPQYDRRNPFKASVLENVNLNDSRSDKKTHHIEISLEDSGITYSPGDALGVYPINNLGLVNELIRFLDLDAQAEITIKKEKLRFKEALLKKLDITNITLAVLKKYQKIVDLPELEELISDQAKAAEWLEGRDLIDVVKHFSSEKKITEQEVASILRPLSPRLYSISSSLDANEDEVHLTVAKVEYEKNGRQREGVCSSYLAALKEDEELEVYVQENTHFRLPENEDTSIIMIGPGTGIAPFRAFLQQREEQKATGKNWLFFGDRHFKTDFLYQKELLDWREKGVLDRLDVAFSRDQEQKVYVQDRIKEHGAEVLQWLQEGAHIYICGDALRMAKDVENSLVEIIQKYSSKTAEEAQSYLEDLKADGRYQRDVY